MKIDGNKIAARILEDLKEEITRLKSKNIIPTLAILLIGDDPASVTYVENKIKKAKEIGLTTKTFRFDNQVSLEEITEKINELNLNPEINGIIVQRPLPFEGDGSFSNLVNAKKDVDGFRTDSNFGMPIAKAALEILKEIFIQTNSKMEFIDWLKSKAIVVIGKGETGGKPIIEMLKKTEIEPIIVDSKTKNPGNVIGKADILISTVGKHNVVNANDVKENSIVIGVGIHKGEDGKLYPDYNQQEIESKVSFYSPIPGGIGPVNVAMLLENVVKAAKNR
jgi:methylenetetrahydrofolate dehydrogenase (NADP+)/methenyltetrahydrofolate cyclohydrolase